MRTYRMRKFQSGRNRGGEAFYNYSLTIPIGLAEQLPIDIEYSCQLLPEINLPDIQEIPEPYRGKTLRGILFEPQNTTPKPSDLPDWARSNNDAPEKEAPKRRPARRRPGSKTT